MDHYSKWFSVNKQLWNNKTEVHLRSEFYAVAGFKAGKSSLNQVELTEVGEVAGKQLLHLQCHFGMDTISWAKQGAVVTGLDLSDKAIDTATALAAELQVPATFVCANVYDTVQVIPGVFDIVYTSYGTIGWLPDLDIWANAIATKLKPGGFFYMVDFHPIVWMFDDQFTKIQYSYFNHAPIVETTNGTYADRQADLHDTAYGWNHPTSEVLNALKRAGLTLDFFNEHASSPYNCFANTVEVTPGEFQIKGLEDKIPMLFSLKCTK
ncbi:bifunctional 2-polyprenyl-6-hydroxyphenol methylase/3-demethylubiquinol 3-O-methyltransferase UbiG [Chitinophaga sp. Cy-1792]|uniref:class I SAM-dependent methyltransferase n=1 Tax=Chitinophaga sp. Cy-1792 TaxID=2608339 RepID=UPI00141D7C0B|nr:class I SAM-dependent methyltransferase [Chitinophaga sp. Cy-1792]NIG55988.1 class I SAM-dependent methyltransferase [Chitinophaga sp. Cy-1792]